MRIPRRRSSRPRNGQRCARASWRERGPASSSARPSLRYRRQTRHGGVPCAAMAIIDVLPTPAVVPPVWDEIWALTRAYYETERGYAEERLKERQRIALFRSSGSRALIGMASIDVYPAVFQGRRLAVIFTSHVLLREEHRGQNLIQQLGLRTFLGARLRYPLRPIYWFFDTFSCKSYLLLAR